MMLVKVTLLALLATANSLLVKPKPIPSNIMRLRGGDTPFDVEVMNTVGAIYNAGKHTVTTRSNNSVGLGRYLVLCSCSAHALLIICSCSACAL